MKYIDINTMIGPFMDKVRCNTADELIAYMESYHAFSAVTAHNGALYDPAKYNGEMVNTAKDSLGQIRACLVLDPMLAENSLPGTGNLYDRLKQLRPAAVRMCPRSTNYPFDAFFCGPILEALNKLRIPLLLSETEAPPVQDTVAAAKAYPELPIVLLRDSFNRSRTIVPMLTKLANIFIDTATMIDTGLLEELVCRYGAEDRLLLGSGLPYHVPAGSLALITYSTITHEQKEKILYKNWERLEGGIRYDD
jgi:hypothetical protein